MSIDKMKKYLRHLQLKHRKLDNIITSIEMSNGTASEHLSQFKKRRLVFKDRIAKITESFK